MLTPQRSGAPERVRERVLPVLVQHVQPTSRSALGGGDVLVLPPAVDQSEGGETAERAVHADLLDAEAGRHLQAVELAGALMMDAQTLEQDLRIEVDQKSTSRSSHDHSKNRRVITP
jgi:hypothetical protein